MLWLPSWKSIFSFSWTKKPIDLKLDHVWVTCRSKIAKIVQIGNPRWPPYWPSWKSTFHLFSWNLEGILRVTSRSRIDKKVPIGTPRWPPWWQFENVFYASSPEQKGQLTQNLIGSIGMTFKSKKGKVVQTRNPRWPPSWESDFSWTERPTDSNLGRKHRGDL